MPMPTATARVDVTPLAPDAVTPMAQLKIDRHSSGLTWNVPAMIRGLTTVALTSHFARQQA